MDTCSHGRVLPDAFADGSDVPPCTDYERRFPVRVSDLDLNQHVNNARYAEWAVESIPGPFLADHCLREIEL